MKRAALYISVCAALVAAVATLRGAPNRKPIYVGSRVCGSCHAGKGMGNQYSLWLHSKHSSAWAVLARPESQHIAEISGLRQKPQESPICLGCHATAYDAEDWQKDETFRIEEGVQCERCHGPGSEYMSEKVMRDKKAAMENGLTMPDEKFCMGCHIEKGSHTAVLKTAPIDPKKGLEMIAHPLPQTGRAMGSIPALPEPEKANGPKYVGSAVCGSCHRGEEHGHQYSLWRMSPHAQAWAVLSSPKGYKEAADKGITGEPAKAPECLKCHTTGYGAARSDTAYTDEGVGCESCHGPGSDYMPEAIMRDRRAAMKAGLKMPSTETCKTCHVDAKFDSADAMKKIAHPTKRLITGMEGSADEVRYKNPLNMAMRPGSKELWVACEGSDSVIIVDTAMRERVAEIPVGRMPADVTFTPDGKLAFVSNRYENTVAVLDANARKVIRKLKTGAEPHGVLTDRAGKTLYVLNTTSEDMSVFDVPKLEYTKTLSASRGPWSLALSPDGATMLVTNMLARFAPFREPFVSEVTEIDTDRAVVGERYVIDGANLMMGIDWHPDGKFAIATTNRTKSLVPMTRLMQGWTITNGLALIHPDGEVDQVLLDEPDMGFADATDVACTKDGRYALVTSAGTDRVAVVDIDKLTTVIRRATPYEREHVLPNDLGYPTEFVVKHIAVKNSPRGILVAPDNRVAYVANALDDSLSVIDLTKMDVASRIDLGGPKEITKRRFGERLFNNAKITFHRQHACHSCHPDGHVDGVTYDIEADGIGVSPVDNRTLRGILDTAPFKWEGTNPSLSRQCGARLAVFFTRLAPFTPEELSAVDYYVTTIERPPNRFRPLGAPLTPAQRRGKVLFERTMANDGREIPELKRCITCHFPPYFTDRQVHDVGTRLPSDRQGAFDTPHLNNIYDSAPYLHNGMAHTLEEIWTVYNPHDTHGVTNDMTKDQLNDLIEYLKTL